jgi:hypothetical protein
MSACNQLGSNGDNHMLQEMTVRGFMCSANEEKAMKSSCNSGIVRLCGGGLLCSPSCTHEHSSSCNAAAAATAAPSASSSTPATRQSRGSRS